MGDSMQYSEHDFQKILEAYPETITKEQLYKICGVSKKTAQHYLMNGVVPCVDTGKKTRRYTIRTVAVIEFLRKRQSDPHAYLAPLGWYKPNGIRENKPRNHTPVMCARLVKALRCLIEQYPDVMTVPDVANLTGYHRETIVRWCSKNKIEHFLIRRAYLIPKEILLQYLTADRCFAINETAKQHILITFKQMDTSLQDN